MSDFFVSEILVLVLLILPLLRPFSKALKTAEAIPVLPIAALITLIFALASQGLIFSFIPTILIVIICIITEFARFVMFLRQVPNSFYTIPSILLRIFVLMLLGTAFFAAFYFSPEREYPVFTSVLEREKISFKPEEMHSSKTEKDSGFKNGKEITAGFYYTPETCNKPNEVIMIIPPFHHFESELGTFARYLLNENYKIVDVPLTKKEGYIYNLKHSEVFLSIFDFLLGKKELKDKETDRNETLIFSVSKLIDFFKDTEIFLIAEGSHIQELCDYYNENKNAFSGAFFIISEDESLPKGLKEGSYTVLNEKDLKFSHDIALLPICIFIQAKEALSGFGDLRGNDILAGLLLGTSRDLGRESRIRTVKTFEKWLNLRSGMTIK